MKARTHVLSWAAVALLASACGSNATDNATSGSEGRPADQTLNAEVASYDLAAGDKSRFIVGLFTGDQRFVSWGKVGMRFLYLGRDQASETPQEGPSAVGRFLPVPDEGGGEPQTQPGPVAVPASQGRGVYAAQVRFDKPGFWSVQVSVDFEGGDTQTANAAFEVLEQHEVPAPGDRALRTENLTLGSKDAPRAAIDSRAQGGGAIPDPELHRTTVADSIQSHEPAVVVISTPVYCVSRFCGPITDMIKDLAADYRPRANFIHIEVWRDFDGTVINKSAADWIYRNRDLREPWVFVIGSDGRIAARFDNVATRDEVESALRRQL